MSDTQTPTRKAVSRSKNVSSLSQKRVLVISSNQRQAATLSKAIKQSFSQSVQLSEASTARNAIRHSQREKIDFALIDFSLIDMHPLALIEALLENSNDMSIVVMIPAGQEILAAEALKRGACDYILSNQDTTSQLQNILPQLLNKSDGKKNPKPDQKFHELQRAHQEISHLVKSLSHDMNANMMMLDFAFQKLKKSIKKPSLVKVLNDIQHIEACLTGSKKFLEDLSMLSESGSVDMQPELIELGEVVHSVIFEQQDAIAERQVEVHLESNLPQVYIHPRRLSQILTNLVRNALKHGCDKNNPKLSISTVAGKTPASNQNFVWLRVYDNGPGISNSESENVFLPGVRLPEAHQHGTGMGLAIVKQIVEQSGGEIYLDTQCKQGSSFIFSIPRNRIESQSKSTDQRSIRTDQQQPLENWSIPQTVAPNHSVPSLPTSTFVPQG